MLWYPAWQATQLRFLTGLVLFMGLAAGTLASYAAKRPLLIQIELMPASSRPAAHVAESVEVPRDDGLVTGIASALMLAAASMWIARRDF